MNPGQSTRQDVESTPDHLSRSDVQRHPTSYKSAVAESWEDDISSGEDTEKEDIRKREDLPNAPPPTPVLPTPRSSWSGMNSTDPYPPSRTSDTGSPSRSSSRPEKQTAVAGRLIAGALGMRAPKKTEEQKAYDRAMKEKELKKRNQEREAQAKAKHDAERAKAAMWDE